MADRDTATRQIAINLFGACVVRGLPPHDFEITGAKHKALFVLLATAPLGRRTRSFMQETLWGAADYDTGRQNLRRALADIKQALGPAFADLISATPSDIALDLRKVAFLGQPRGGIFLEGLDVRTPAFLRWLNEIRRDPAQLDGLFMAPHRPLPATAAPLGVEQVAQGAARHATHAAVTLLPTIAVIPFRAIGGAPEQAIFGDWLAEEMCRALSRSHLMAVISHLSCRQFATAAIEIARVRERLGVTYCVVGSLRPEGARLVLDVDFIDAVSGRLLWTRQYLLAGDRPLEAAFETVRHLVETVGRSVADEAIAATEGRVPATIEDHRLVVAGVGLLHRPALRDFARSRDLLEEARARAPLTPEIHAWLAKWYVLCVFNGWSTTIAADTQTALDYTARALDISPTNSFCLSIDGFAQNNLLKRLDIAEQRYRLALDHNPNEALSWLLQGVLAAFRDEGGRAVEATVKARQLSPIDPFGYFYDSLSASARLAAGDYAEALMLVDRSLAINNRHLSSLRTRIAALHYLGRQAEARETAAELLQRQPDFTLEAYRRGHPAAEFASGQRVIAALRASGLP